MTDMGFKTPFNCMIAGSSGSGKTTLLYKILRYQDEIFETPPEKIYLFYSEPQEIYNNMEYEGVVDKLIMGTPTSEKLKQLVSPYKKKGGTVCIFDDALKDITDDMEYIFTTLTHHLNMSVFFLTQSLFFQNKSYRTMTLNAHYLFVMKSPRDSSQISHLAKQVSPYKTKFVIDSYQNATRRPYTYLLIDLHQRTPDYLRYLSNIVPSEWPMEIYVRI